MGIMQSQQDRSFLFQASEKVEGMELLGDRSVGDTALAGNQEVGRESSPAFWFRGRGQ
jgi:hypothetical protein